MEGGRRGRRKESYEGKEDRKGKERGGGEGGGSGGGIPTVTKGRTTGGSSRGEWYFHSPLTVYRAILR